MVFAVCIAASAEIAAGCRVELAFEKYRFPGFAVPKGQTPFSHLSELCWEGARRRYHPLTPAVVAQLAHELVTRVDGDEVALALGRRPVEPDEERLDVGLEPVQLGVRGGELVPRIERQQ